MSLERIAMLALILLTLAWPAGLMALVIGIPLH